MLHQFLFLFIDGIGLGAPNSSNPFTSIPLPGFARLSGNQVWDFDVEPVSNHNRTFVGIDATLGIPGLPQSGTGQATLFTGINCADIVGRHFGPFPHSATRDTIRKYNMFTQVKDRSGTSAFSNAFPPIFFKVAQKRDRWSVTTRSCLDSGTEIRTFEDLAEGSAVAADITGERGFSDLGLEVNVLTERDAARNLVSIASLNSITLFEYFHSDKAGHAQSADQAERCLASLDRFIDGILDFIEGTNITLLLTSDHGNLEDLSIKTHTRNPVPFAACGPAAETFYNISSITEVTPRVINLMD